MTDPIKDALRAACETDGLFGIQPEADRDIVRDRAAAVAAFLTAYAAHNAAQGIMAPDLAEIAAAVERAARDE